MSSWPVDFSREEFFFFTESEAEQILADETISQVTEIREGYTDSSALLKDLLSSLSLRASTITYFAETVSWDRMNDLCLRDEFPRATEELDSTLLVVWLHRDVPPLKRQMKPEIDERSLYLGWLYGQILNNNDADLMQSLRLRLAIGFPDTCCALVKQDFGQ